VSASDRFQAMWSILDMLKPEGYVLLLEEDQRICWIAPRDEVARDSLTDRSKYGDWGSFIGRSSVEYLARHEVIMEIADPGRRNRECFELGDLGRKALEEKQTASSDRCERLWIVVYEGEAYPYVGFEEPNPKSVAAAWELASL
jgi:hypothetical protein